MFPEGFPHPTLSSRFLIQSPGAIVLMRFGTVVLRTFVYVLLSTLRHFQNDGGGDHNLMDKLTMGASPSSAERHSSALVTEDTAKTI